MDRLSLVAALALALGCEKAADPVPPPSRVNAVKAGEKKEASADDFCDVRFTAENGPAFQVPALAGNTTAPKIDGDGWHWVNVWATWCKPCVEEIPRLERWRGQNGGMPLHLVSVDDNDQIVADFRKAHPEIPSGVRLADPNGLPAWLKALGLDEAAPIPVHVFVRQGKTRCVRAGGVGEPDLPAVQKVLAER